MFADFKFLLLAAFILIFMILASVFESLTTPFVLLFSIPLAAIGSLLALLLTGNSLLNNANVMIGFLILLGVVVNNGIILIDYANILRRRGYRRNRALMTAGLSRIRPILITSITTIVAMFPMAMGNSEYAGAIGAPFAITVIGGLSFSALLTLILIPTVCMGLENTLQWYRGLSLKVWVLHGLLFMAGASCIWLYGGSLLWQSVYGVLLLAGIPGATYFMQASLRRARSKVIDPEADIHISVRNLVKIYDWPGRVSRQWKSGLLIRRRPFKALRGVSFEIRTGMFGLLGPNGAGKSTLMRIICGILEQSYGSIWINGLDTRIYREELQSLIGFLPQEFGTYENMSSWEFLDYQAILKGLVDPGLRRERLEYVLRAVHMFDRKDEKIGSFSGGMKQRIGIALILLHLPRILVVDEPTAGLDPRERIRFRNLLVELSKDRIVIFSTHIIEDISSSCSQVAVINKGSLKYFGDPVDMVGMAAGKVWQFDIDKTEFEQALDKSRIVNHIQKDDRIRVRYLSVISPHDEAVQVEPNLEDAYLCLLKGI